MEAGKFAPSGMNRQPWHFTVVQNSEALKKINKGCCELLGKTNSDNFSAFYNAPTLIIVSGEEKTNTAAFDCPLALENMFLAAESIGIGSCWIFSVQVLLNEETGKELKKELDIPEDYTAYAAGSFGYKAAEQPVAAPRKENIVNIIK